MPGGDGTGPIGLGPRTGRARGFCSGFNLPGYANPGFGKRIGFGRGMGFGGGYARRRFGFMPLQKFPPTNEQEVLQQQLSSIEQEEKMLQQEKQELQKRIEGLKQHE